MAAFGADASVRAFLTITKPMRRIALLSLAFALAACQKAPPPAAPVKDIYDASASSDARRIEADVRFLADDLLEGRETGTRGYDLASLYVAQRFRAMGLAPAGDGGSYFQRVPMLRGVLQPEGNALAIVRDGREQALAFRDDFLPGINFNEAQAALDAGVAAKLIDPSKSEYSDLVGGLKSKPKATKADLAEATKTAQSGMALLRIGDRYASMGDYAKAVELYKMSMGKPGVDAGVANLHIGMALARAGDKAGATTALNAVTGPRADIAKFWLTYLNTKA